MTAEAAGAATWKVNKGSIDQAKQRKCTAAIDLLILDLLQ